MSVKISVSVGELVDKITILKIKKKKIQDPSKLTFVEKEFSILSELLSDLKLVGIEPFLAELEKINTDLWEIEDDIREKERQKAFDEEFIALARSVYITNDKRFEVKARCNSTYGGDIQEVKSYQDYK